MRASQQKRSIFTAAVLGALLLTLPSMPVSAQAQQKQCKQGDRYCQRCIEDADDGLQRCLEIDEENARHAPLSGYKRRTQFCKNQHYHSVRGCLGLYPA